MAIEESEIEDAGKTPLRVKTDEGYVEERPVDDLIKADRYSASKSITRVPFGLSFARTQPAGPNGRN